MNSCEKNSLHKWWKCSFLDLQSTNLSLEEGYTTWFTKLLIIIGSICLNYAINDPL